MKNMIQRLVLIGLAMTLLNGCTPEVGSPEWCKMMKEKPKGEWTANQGKDFLKHCLMPSDKKD